MLKLYQFPISHYCEKIRWALDYKGLDYKIINLMPGEHIKVIRAIAPKTEVPVLQHGDEVIQGSAAIITWLDEKFPDKPLTPQDEIIKKEALEWENYIDENVGPHLRLYFYNFLLDRADLTLPLLTHGQPWYKRLVFRLMYPKVREVMRKFLHINDRTVAISLKKLTRAIDKLTQHYEHDPFLAGNQFSRADLTAAAMLAPICAPAKYGLSWPENYPDELKQTIADFRKKLGWVDLLYQNYR